MKRNVSYKLLALAIAVVIWAYANEGLNPSVSKELPIHVEFASVPPMGYRVGESRVSPSSAVVAGTAQNVNAIRRLVVKVDPGDSAESIDDDFPVIACDKHGRPAQNVELSPAKARLRLELREAPARRVAFVSPSVVGQPPFPCKVRRIDVSPESVSVTGPPERLLDVTMLKTEPVELSNRTETFSRDVRVILPPGLTLEEEKSVHVIVHITSPPPVEKAPPPPDTSTEPDDSGGA